MTLAASGEISIGGSTANRSINLELGRSATATSSLGETSLRTLAGVASGEISMSNFYNKSSSPPATFSPVGNTNPSTPRNIVRYNAGNVTITCNTTATWTWSGPQNTTSTVSVSSGGSSTTITFGVADPPLPSQTYDGYWTATGTVSGYSQYWTIYILKGAVP